MNIEPLALGGNLKIGIGILIGFIAGFALTRADLIWKKSLLDILTLKDGRLIKTVLFFMGFGSLSFFILQRYGVVNVNVLVSYLWASIIGGVLSGIGIVIGGFTPVTAVMNFFTGRLYVIWSIVGMLLAIPVIRLADNFLDDTLYKWSKKIDDPMANSSTWQFWEDDKILSASNGALVVFAISCVLIVIVQLTLGDSSEE